MNCKTTSQLKVRTRVHLATAQKAQHESIKGLHTRSRAEALEQASCRNWRDYLRRGGGVSLGRGVSRQFSRADARKIHPALDTHTAPCTYTLLYLLLPSVSHAGPGKNGAGCVFARWHYVLFTACGGGGGPTKGQLVQTNVSLPWQNIIK